MAQILLQKQPKQDKTITEQCLELSGAAGSRRFKEAQSTIGHFFLRAGHLRQTYMENELWSVLEFGILESTKHCS